MLMIDTMHMVGSESHLRKSCLFTPLFPEPCADPQHPCQPFGGPADSSLPICLRRAQPSRPTHTLMATQLGRTGTRALPRPTPALGVTLGSLAAQCRLHPRPTGCS